MACRFDALTPDIALNRIMKAAVMRLARIARTTDYQRRLRELACAYADIADVPVAALRWDEVTLDRTNARWRKLLNLARLLLGERFSLGTQPSTVASCISLSCRSVAHGSADGTAAMQASRRVPRPCLSPGTTRDRRCVPARHRGSPEHKPVAGARAKP